MRFDMHISETQTSPDILLTKCSKMNEEAQKRHGMNGNVDGVVKEEFPKTNYGTGGRLKFFKDGKFILELERAREGERVSWVSVPRKTFWPPQGTATSTPTYRQESSASLSVSDDNSSIQSSPWQRDHSWKQTTPRRNQSKQLSFFYWRSKPNRFRTKNKKRRRPYSVELVIKSEVLSDAGAIRTKNAHRRRPLLAVVQNLIEKNAQRTTPPRAVPETLVSPRKRFLREMEKDKVQTGEDATNCQQKRSRSKTAPALQTAGVAVVTTSSVVQSSSVGGVVGSGKANCGSPMRVNGCAEDVKPTPTAVQQTQQPQLPPQPPKNCSYSITSLLADDRNVPRRSPNNNSPSHFTPPVTTNQSSQFCSVKSEDRWYSESVDRLRSIELSQVDKRSLSSYPHHSYLPPYGYPYSLPPYYAHGIYGRGYVVPPMYHHPTPNVPLTVVRQDGPSCSWNSGPSREIDIKEDITDMPLNLSKHSG